LCRAALSAFWHHSEPNRRSKAHEFFLLRNAVTHRSGASDFYAGQVACAFNQITTCEEKFKKILAVKPKSSAAKRIHQILAAVALREGRYEQALHEIDALLAIDPKNTDARDSRPLLEVLSHFPNQGVQAGADSKAAVLMEDGKVPLTINGRPAAYLFDSGANLSVLSESEAVRLGTEIQRFRSEDAKDINGNKVSFRIALLKPGIGRYSAAHVGFLVADNDQQPFPDRAQPGNAASRIASTVSVGGSDLDPRRRVFEAEQVTCRGEPVRSDIWFDDLDLIVQAQFEQHTLSFVLDTGAESSDLWPKFAKTARSLIRKSANREFHTVTGMGGAKKFEIISIPKVVLQLGGKSVTLQPAHVLTNQERSIGKWFYGNLGIDVLQQAQRVTIDFRKMTLQLDGNQQ
jgi:predicted aspartyl protease